MALSRILSSALSGLASIATSGSATDLTGTLAKARLPSGSVLQVLQTVCTTRSSTTSTSWVDATNFSVNITPSSSSSKILVMLSCQSAASSVNWSGAWVRVARNGSAIGSGVGENVWNITDVTSNENTVNYHSHYLDSPSSTAQQTYQVQFRAEASQTTVYVARSYQDNGAQNQQILNVITVMEIAG